MISITTKTTPPAAENLINNGSFCFLVEKNQILVHAYIIKSIISELMETGSLSKTSAFAVFCSNTNTQTITIMLTATIAVSRNTCILFQFLTWKYPDNIKESSKKRFVREYPYVIKRLFSGFTFKIKVENPQEKSHKNHANMANA